MKLRKMTILITGGTSGIGLELARQLLAKGNVVIITGRDQAKLALTKRELPGVHTFQSDVSDPAAIATLYAALVEDFPALNVLINNAGVMRNIDLQQVRDLTDLTREIDIDLCGPIRMVQQFLPHLISRGDALIVNVSSGLAFVPMPISPIYSAAKAAIHAYSQALRVQLAETGVRVVELAPPPVETPLLRGEFEAETAGRRAMPPHTLVKRAISGIEASKFEIRPGLSNVLKTMSRAAPEFMLGRMAAMNKPSAGAGRRHSNNLRGKLS